MKLGKSKNQTTNQEEVVNRHYTYNAASERMSLKILIPATTRHLKVECVIELVQTYV